MYPRREYSAPKYAHVADGDLETRSWESESLLAPNRTCRLMVLHRIAALPWEPAAANSLRTIDDAISCHIHAVGSVIGNPLSCGQAVAEEAVRKDKTKSRGGTYIFSHDRRAKQNKTS